MSSLQEMVNAIESLRREQQNGPDGAPAISIASAAGAEGVPQLPATFEDQLRVEGKRVSAANRARTRSQTRASTQAKKRLRSQSKAKSLGSTGNASMTEPPKKRPRRSQSAGRASKLPPTKVRPRRKQPKAKGGKAATGKVSRLNKRK